MHLDRRLLGWGLFFILVGAIPLASRAGLLDTALVERWASLWPLLLIGWGLGLLLRRTPIEWFGGAITAIVFGIMGGGLITTGFHGVPGVGGCGDPAAGTTFGTKSGTAVANGKLDLELDCGSLTLRPTADVTWSISGTESQGRAPRVDVEGSTVSIASGARQSIFGDDSRSDWTVDVPRDLDLDLDLTIDAGDANADLGQANLGDIDLTVNAGSANLSFAGSGRLGSVDATVNAGSAQITLPDGSHSASITVNAGSASVCFDPAAPIRVTVNGALGSNNLPDAGLTRVDGHTWTSTGFDPSAPFLDLRVTANVGAFALDRNGVCSA